MSGLSPHCRVCHVPLAGVRAIPPRVLRGVHRHPKNPNFCNICGEKDIKGEIAEITVLFADVRGFTPLTTALGAMRIKELLDEYFRTVSHILFEQDAIVDHFMGDAVMAFFNQPVRHPDHIRRAVTSAREILGAVTRLNGGWRLAQAVGVGVGISTGFAAVGTVGSANPKDYTAIGDVVNLAARLQGQAEAGQIIVTSEVYEQVRELYPGARPQSLEVKGFANPVEVVVLN
jgi:adenylate cyclase